MTECHIYLFIYFSLQSHLQNNDFELMFIFIPTYAKIGSVKFILTLLRHVSVLIRTHLQGVYKLC